MDYVLDKGSTSVDTRKVSPPIPRVAEGDPFFCRRFFKFWE